MTAEVATTVTTAPWRAQCGCGELLTPGEAVGEVVSTGELLCLWCLADVRAGRPRTSHRKSPVVAVPVKAQPAQPMRRARRRRRGPNPVISLLLAAAIVSGALWLNGRLGGGEDGTSVAGIPVRGADYVPFNPGPAADPQVRSIWPPVPDDAQSSPLGMPPAQDSDSDDYAFLTVVDGTDEPVRFDPCRPIRLVVNESQAPEQADQLLREAIAEVNEATGLRLVIEGPTDEAPTTSRPTVDEARYGDRWSPVLVAWTDPATVPDLAGRVAGVGGPAMAPYRTASDMHWVSGLVYLDAPDLAQIRTGPAGYERVRAIIVHEIAHLVGLAHVEDRYQLMAAENSGQVELADGDREGLRRLGGGPCFS